MSRIAATFEKLKRRNEGALIVFIVAGHPSPEESQQAVAAIADAGADIIELGIPFSDPLADGPAIQAASQRALEHGVTPADVLEMVRRFRGQRDTPVVLMTCYNPIHQYGVDRFAGDASGAGVDGAIVTDLPPEEAGGWVAAARGCGVDTIFLLAPTSSPERMKKVVDLATGFVYCVSRMGVTGAREEVPEDLKGLVARIRSVARAYPCPLPIAVGFGISRAEHVAQVCEIAEGAVVGSALVTMMHRERGAAGLGGRVCWRDPIPAVTAAAQFVEELKAATRGRRASS